MLQIAPKEKCMFTPMTLAKLKKCTVTKVARKLDEERFLKKPRSKLHGIPIMLKCV